MVDLGKFTQQNIILMVFWAQIYVNFQLNPNSKLKILNQNIPTP